MVYYGPMIEHHVVLKLVVEQWDVSGRILGFDLWILKELGLLDLEDKFLLRAEKQTHQYVSLSHHGDESTEHPQLTLKRKEKGSAEVQKQKQKQKQSLTKMCI